MAVNHVGLFIRDFKSYYDNGANQQVIFFFKLLINMCISCYLFTEPTISNECLTQLKKYIPGDKIKTLNPNISFNQFENISHIIFLTYLPLNNQFIRYLKCELNIKLYYLISMNYINSFKEYLLFGKNKFINSGFYKNISNHIEFITFDMYKNDLHLLSTYYDKKIHMIPHIWDDELVKDIVKWDTKSLIYSKKGIDFIICEPNISSTKSCFIPILIASKMCSSTSKIHITCCSSNIIKRIKNMFHQISNKFIFYKRINIFELIKNITVEKIPIVISHQHNNCSNYLYYELIFSRVILIHNSNFIKNYGIYYDETQSIDISLKDIGTNVDIVRNEILFNISPLNEKNCNLFLESIDYKICQKT